MAEQSMDVQHDPTEAPPPQAAPPEAMKNGAGHDAADADGETVDLKALQAELAKVKRAHGQLLNERSTAKAERDKLSAALRDWNTIADEHGVEPGQLKEMLTAREAEEHDQAKQKGEVDKLLAQRDQKHQRDLDKLRKAMEEREADIAQRQALIDRLTIDQQLEHELAKWIEPDPGLKRGAFAIHRPKVKAVADPEAPYGVRVVAEVGGDEMGLADYVKHWVENDQESWPYLAKNKSGGGGAPPGAGGRPGPGMGMKRSTMTAKQKSDFINQHGKARYDALPMK